MVTTTKAHVTPVVRTFVKTKDQADATDIMFKLALAPGFEDVKADFFVVEDDTTISFVSPTTQDGIDTFWIFAGAGLVDIRAGIRQRRGMA